MDLSVAKSQEPPAHVKRGKTDAPDAAVACEAVTRKTMRFVPIKSADQHATAIALKARELLARQQTS